MSPFALAPLISAVLGAIAGALGLTIAFSLVIFGVARFDELRRVRRSGTAAAYGVLGAAATVAVVGLVVFGVILVTSK